ncbi:hypothetical protein PSU4_13270 [Pseudonocardia sulfidoxydans NBRC 16205]|uniref:Uncharacterized protein n=1 Tax=Pseudonocardia sulfidoxydans NBRC 16205 TaxID=1223511 RepID=A0A511DDC9_9PSEU|nr:hypothetical protein [Pseudonocardia sulfidoxydans]GEL22373.1 hypothetical protein PSU4_13270 [Pseudonocardia sulfidoxydans NBRC 16205]
MWGDLAIALACVGFTIAVALVALELGTIGRSTTMLLATDARRRHTPRPSRPRDHARP